MSLVVSCRHWLETKTPFGNWSMDRTALHRARAEGAASSERREMISAQQTLG